MCLSKECIDEYLDKLADGIKEYMEMPASQRSAEAINSMVEAWEHIKALSDIVESMADFTREDAKVWCENMINSDGTKGGHWSINDTDGVGRPEDVDDYIWNATMNMIYSDYADVAQKYGVGSVEFYADMAEAFLYDDDGPAPSQKLSRYYNYVVKNNED